jgi:hypothetical protein
MKLDEGQQVSVDRLGLGGRHAVRESLVRLQRPVRQQPDMDGAVEIKMGGHRFPVSIPGHPADAAVNPAGRHPIRNAAGRRHEQALRR